MPANLSLQLVLSYVGIMTVASLVGGLMTILLEQPHVDDTVDTMTQTMMESELESLNVRLGVLLATSAALFVQFVGDVNYQHTYATSVFNGTKPVSSFYPSYDVRDHDSNPPPNVGTDGISIEYSSWYKHTDVTNVPYLNLSSVLDNSHGAVIKSNPSFAAGVYMGFEDGMMRNYPYQDVAARYQTMSYTCAHSQLTVVGYDPRCRGWYNAALLNQSEVVFTTPYNDASTGLVMITLARAVLINQDSFMVGAVGADITLESLEATVLSATVMDNGYTYMCDGSQQLIVHPALDYSADSTIYRVTEKEFDPDAEDEVLFFERLLEDHVLKGEVGQNSFTKNGDTWHVSYGPVNGTSYFLLMVVPDSDITKSADALESDADAAITVLIVVVVLVLCFIIVVGTFFAVRTSRKITEPVEVFNKILHDIAEQKDEGLPSEVISHEYRDINNLRHKIGNLFLAVKFSTESYFKGDFQDAIACLNEVEEMFRIIDQKRALGVVYNNKGNILRRAEGKQDGFASALKALKASVDNISEYIDSTEAKLRATASEDLEQRRQHNELLSLFQGILASRLSNYGDCLREAGRHEDALDVLSTSYDLNSGVDNLKGMIQALGNKGLVFVDLKNYHEAQLCFAQAMEMADNQFAGHQDEKTLSSVQQASMNLGLFYYSHAKETLIDPGDDQAVRIEMQDPESRRLLEMALQKLYITLLVADRIPMHVKKTCVHTLREIYIKYYGDVGAAACDKLVQMFPDVGTGGSNNLKINFLIDVSPSMSGPRIRSCEQTLVNIVENKMKNGDMIAVNVFARAYDILIPATQLSGVSRPQVVDSLRTLPFRTNKGCTHFYSALSRMANELATANGKTTEQWLVALTDGEDNERLTTYQHAKRICVESNVKVIMISVGLDSPAVLDVLKYLASEEKYFLKSTDDPAAITDALGKGFDMAASGNVMMESL